jgi:hypothetical protein
MLQMHISTNDLTFHEGIKRKIVRKIMRINKGLRHFLFVSYPHEKSQTLTVCVVSFASQNSMHNEAINLIFSVGNTN